MTKRSLASPDDQGVTFVELFFDLVFVFAVTQVAHHAAHHLDAWSLFNTVVAFWLVWWAWTQFTWALNAANTDLHEIRLGTLISTAVAFVMAVSISGAFGDQALWFGGSYVLVRILGLGLYYRVAAHDPEQQRGVRTFALASLLGLALVIVGALTPPSARPWVWLGVVVFDVVAAFVAGRHGSWNLHAGHFAERHGLIVIIALGESLIVAGSGVEIGRHGTALLVDGLLAVVATCLLWWTYFGWAKDALEKRLESVKAHNEEALARDAYSLGHFPLITGVVCFAVGLVRIVEGGGSDVSRPVAAMVATGVLLFVGAMAAALRRAAGYWVWPRLVVTAITCVAVYLCAPAPAWMLLGIICFGLATVIVFEHVRCDAARCSGETA